MSFVYILLYFTALIAFVEFFYNAVEVYFVNGKETEIMRYANFLSSDVSINGYLSNVSGVAYKGIEDEIKNISKMYDARVIILDNKGMVVNDSSGTKIGKTIATKEILGGLNGKHSISRLKDKNIINVVTSIRNYHTENIEGVIFISCSLDGVYEVIYEIKAIVLYLFIIIGIIISFILVFITHIYTKPLNKLLRKIKKISHGHLEEKLKIGKNDEFADISTAVNHMTEKLLAIDNSRKEFVSNVSHELKTPLSSIKVLTESLLLQDNVSPEIYKEFLQDINSEIDRQAAIINDLLMLVKLDEKEKAFNVTNVNLNELLEQILKRLHPLAKQKNVELIIENIRNVNADIDEMKLTIALSNLIENGIKYNKENGRIIVTVDADYENAYLTIKDTGIGIPKEHFDKIFQRFYRVDKTRDRATGGTGLGLSITHKVILLHKGNINIDSEVNVGTKFIVTIPLRQIYNRR